MPDEVLYRWRALSIVDDWAGDRTAELLAGFHNSLMILAAKLGRPVDEKDFRSSKDYEKTFARPKAKTTRQDPTDQFNLLKSISGL